MANKEIFVRKEKENVGDSQTTALLCSLIAQLLVSHSFMSGLVVTCTV